MKRWLRIWIDINGFVLPLTVIVAYLLEWSPVVRTVLTAVCFAGVFSTWAVTEDLPRWRARQRARLRRLRRRVGGTSA